MKATSPSGLAGNDAASVVAVAATCRRAPELKRLIASLEESIPPVRALVVVDNGGDAETQSVVKASRLTTVYLDPGTNLGCGGGLAEGERAAMEKFGAELTHLWILDDDASVSPEALRTLLDSMAGEQADAAHPLVTDPAGELGWHPGLLDPVKFAAIQARQRPEEFFARCGSAPIPFSWAQGIALLVTRRAVDQVGFHRADYWVRGEDLEFSLRITARFRGIYVPAARVAHLPPPASSAASRDEEYAKHRAMLQNIAYTALRLPHGRRIARTIPGNLLRFFKTWKWTPRALAGAVTAIWDGAIRGLPAGAESKQ
jgi:GT2 family glycosyltransferase